MQRLRANFDRYWYAWAMVTPVIVVLALLVFYPLVQGIWMSFTNLNEANQAAEVCSKTLGGAEVCEPNPNKWSFIGLENYTNLLTGQVGNFWQLFRITLIWTVACVVFHYTIGLALAVLLHREIRGRGLYRVLLIVPWAIPAFVASFAWKFIYDRDYGIINAYSRLPSVWQTFAARTTVTDFRPQRMRQWYEDLSQLPEQGGGETRVPQALPRVPELTEYPTFTLAAEETSYGIAKYGKRFPFSWEVFINDELQVIMDLPGTMASTANDTEISHGSAS